MSIEDVKTADREGVAARIYALKAAEKSLSSHSPEAIQAIRRISHSLKVSRDIHEYPHLAEIVLTLERTPDVELSVQLQRLLPRLQDLTLGIRSDKVRILVVDDDPVVAEILSRNLAAPNRELIVAKSAAQAERALADRDVSLILLDLVLPDDDGRNLLVRLRERPATASTPIFVLSTKSGDAVQTECFALGADACFVKPFNPMMLSTAVASRLQRSAEMVRQSDHDPLTRLPNRAAFYKAFWHAGRLATRSREPLAMAMLDLDRFKAVNDLYGHPMGDEVLRRSSAAIARALRSSDVLARWGGEEFAVFLPNTDLTQAKHALEKASLAVREEIFPTPDGKTFHMSFSAGIALVREGASVEQAIAEADRYLYLAKAAGRNQVLTELDKVTPVKKNILLVEDDELTATIIKQHLKRDGFNILHAKESKTALAIARETTLSLVTLDVKMPGTDGFELLQQFRQIPSIAQTPIVMLTWLGNQEDIVRGFQLGADDYILKPFSPAEFLARIHRLLRS